MEYASKGVAGSGLGLGIAGTALGLLNGGGGLLNGLVGNGNCNCHENMPVNRYELNLTNEIAAKDAKIGLLESNIYTDQKITDTYAALNGQRCAPTRTLRTLSTSIRPSTTAPTPRPLAASRTRLLSCTV